MARPERSTTCRDDKLFCVYVAEDPEAIRDRAAKGGFPVTAMHRIGTMIDPSTGEAAA